MSRTVAVFPCSSSQRRLWLLEQLGRGGRSMTVRAPLLLEGAIEPERARQALELMVRRHESLRTTFAELNGHGVQLVHPAGGDPIDLGVTHLSGRATRDRGSAALRGLADSLTEEPFDLSRGPLVRAHLVRAARSSILLLAFHHIVVDGWSVGILHEELRALLAPRTPDVAVRLAPLRLHYADFALWEQRQLSGDAHAQDLAWWRALHEDAPDRPALFSPYQDHSAGARIARQLDEGTVARVRGLAATSGATAFSVLLTAYADALHALSGQSDLVIGTPVAGRGRTDLEGVVGFFVNTLPLRVRVQEDLSLAERVRAVHGLAVEAIERQHVPFEDIFRVAGRPDRPMFEAMFNLLEGRTLPGSRLTAARTDGVPADETHHASAASAHATVELYVMDYGGERIDLELVYATGQLDEATATGLVAEVVARLADPPSTSAGVVSAPAQAMPEVDERWDGAIETDLIARFLRITEAQPDAPAIRSAAASWTYAQLAAHAVRIGAAIASAGVRHERVGVLAGHNADAVAAVLGVLAGGAAYVPLDAAAPEGRLAGMIADADVHLVLHDGSAPALRDWLAPAPGLEWIDVRTVPPAPRGWRPWPVEPDAVAYILYTSGTTGEPKGVVQSHRNVLGHLRNYAGSLGLAPGDTLSWLPGLGTDAAVMDIFGALLTGACLQPLDVRSVGLDELPEVLATGATTILHATPTLFRAFAGYLADGTADDPPRERLAGVRAVVLGGEAATSSDLAIARLCFPKQTLLVNGYGPTECTVALQFVADHTAVVRGDALPLGRPVPGVLVSVVDGAGDPVGPGGVGEIVLHSRYLSPGYWRRPEETAERFVPGVVPGYRTGDLGRVHPDGTITFAGRADDQFKIHGVRVEATEVEAALRRQPGVTAAAVTHDDGLTAHLVVADRERTTPAALRRGLRRLLPDAMIPSRFLQVDRLPLTPSGKIDRGALAVRNGHPLTELRRQATAPVDRWHAAVAAVWAEVLDLDPDDLGPDDSFFDFGGHSLLMTQVAARLDDRLGVRLPLRTLFDNPSLADLATTVAALAGRSERTDAATGLIPRRDHPGPFPLSSAQARLWFLEQLNPGTATYTMNLTLPVEAGSTLADVQAAVDQLMARHEALRTTFDVIEGTPRQHVDPTLRVVVRHTQLSSLDRDVAAARQLADSAALATTVFDLTRGPLLRAHFADLGQQGGQLFLAIHHIIADGWSLGLLRREFGLLLAASRDGKGSPLTELPIQYPDYALWEHQHLARDEGGRWWRDALRGIPERLQLPQSRPRPAQPTSAGGLVSQSFGDGLARRLRRLAHSRGLTPFMLYLAGFVTVLHRWSGQADLVIGTPVAGRTRVEVEGVVGLFVNSLPLRVPVEPDETFPALLDTVRDVVSAAQDHQSVPFEEIVRQAAPQRRLATAPIFQVMFALGSTQDETTAGGAVSHTGTAKFDLSVTVDDGPVPGVHLEYSADIYGDAAARQLLGAMVRLLQEVAEDPNRMLSRIPLGPDPGSPAPPQRSSARTPEVRLPVPQRGPGLAVVGPGTAVTHSQLVDLVSAWVARLRGLALPAGSVVAVDLPRGPELIAAMLAVPAAGLCLLLLDPRLPESRRRDLLDRSGARALLDADLLATSPAVEKPGDLPVFDADLPAYIVPTSGTTGTPKLVVVPRRAMAAQIGAVTERYRMGAADRVLQFAAVGFDVAIEEIWPTVAVGGCIELGPASRPPTFDELATLCGPGGVTVLNLPASYWHAWVASLGQGADGAGVPAGLRLVVVGSEPVLPQAVARWHELTRCRLLCAYGTTETTITNAVFEPPREWPWRAYDRVPIGDALPSCRLLVVDPDGRQLPPGVLGELAVEGVCVADGYLGDAEQTTRAFVKAPAGRRYLTGDLARLTLFGAFEVLGRLDDQVKLAGHRIEPGEVEAALLRLPGVRSAAVAIRARADGYPRLVGYLVGDPPLPEPAELRALLGRQLPEHLVPAEFMTLTDLPRTPNGKLDRSRLPLPTAPPPPSPTGRPLAGPLEWAVARVWAEVLRIPLASVSADSNFFHLGGDSILSLQVAWRLGAEGVTVSLAELFEHQSVADLAAAIEAGGAGTDDAGAWQPGAGETGGPIPLLPIQRWALSADPPDPSHDNQAVLLQLDGSVPDARLRVALASVIARHEALRSRFVRAEGHWQVHVADAPPLPLEVHGPGADLPHVAARSHTSLSLDGPLIRADLLPAFHPDGERDDTLPSRLLMVANHLVIDFVSWQILLDDLRTALLNNSDEPVPPPAGTTWTAWSRRLADWANGPEALADARWWLDRLSVTQGLVHLPAGATAPGGRSRDERVLRVVVDQATTRRLVDLPRSLGAGVEDALVAGVGRAVAEASQRTRRVEGHAQADPVVLVDVEGHGREPLFADLDPTRLVGWLTTLRPVPVRVPADAPIADQVLAVRDSLRSMPRHGIAYGAIRELRTVPDPDADALRRLPRAQVSVNYLGRTGASSLPPAGLLTAGGPAPGPNRSPDAPRPYTLDVVAMVRDEQLVLWWSYAETLTAEAEVAALAARSVDLLAELAATAIGDDTSRPDATPVAAYPLTPMQEAMVFGVASGRGSGVNIEQSVLPLPAHTDAGRLLAAWEHLVARHDILRTRFVEDSSGTRRQEVLDRVRVPWRTLDWSHVSESEAAERLAQFLAEDRYRGFATDHAPLMRLVLIQLPAGPRLLWSHHHALLDGWSASAVLDELAVLLGSTEEAARLPHRASFRSHVTWLAHVDPAAHQAHWAAQFSAPPRPARLPLAPPDPAGPLAAALGVPVTGDLRAGLVRRAAELRVTPATVVQAAWALVLGAHTGTRDVVFGVTSSGRPAQRPEAASIIGLMITTHPCRVRTPSRATLAEWIRELAALEIANREHAHAGLIEIARCAGLPLDAAPFDSLLVVENYRRPAASADTPRHEPQGADAAVREVDVREAPDVPLCVVVGADYGLRVIYDARRIDRDWVAGLLTSLVTAIRGIVEAGPGATVGDVDVLGAARREQLLRTWNDTARPLPEKPLGALWAEAATRHAREVAVVDPTPDGVREVSYAALADAARRIAALLWARGVRPGDLVGVAAERSAELVAAILGIIQTGGAYVPLDTAYPDDRLALLVADTGMRAVVTRRHLLAGLPEELAANAVILDGLLDASPWAVRTASVPEPGSAVDPESPAYVMYTSGSTGRPKGVVVPHRAVTRLVLNADYVHLGPGNAVAMASNVAFDASTFELWAPLLSGARLVIAEPDTLLSPRRLGEFLHRHVVNVMFLTTAAFNMVAAEEPTAFARLDTLLFGGERVDPGSVRRVLRAGPPGRLLHVYGPTEATTFACWHEVRAVGEDALTVPIGRPIANTELLVLDDDQRLVAPGAEGELCVGGPGLALGYLGDPDLTRRRFVPHPYRPGQVLYRTGDTVVQDAEGVIEIRGRTDEQVKIRGFRIEPGEIESHLCSAPGVAAAVVVPRREANDVHFLAAYVTPLRDAVLEPARVRSFLRERLPAHLVPATVTVLEALPLTPNAKVDRSALPDPRAGDPGAAGPADEQQPGTDLERAVAAIWGRVLRMDPATIARGQDFFELGGHSLLLTQVAARLRDELEVDIPLRVLFDVRTLGDVASLVGATERTPLEQIPVADRGEYVASIDERGRLIAPPALRARLFVEE